MSSLVSSAENEEECFLFYALATNNKYRIRDHRHKCFAALELAASRSMATKSVINAFM